MVSAAAFALIVATAPITDWRSPVYTLHQADALLLYDDNTVEVMHSTTMALCEVLVEAWQARRWPPSDERRPMAILCAPR